MALEELLQEVGSLRGMLEERLAGGRTFHPAGRGEGVLLEERHTFGSAGGGILVFVRLPGLTVSQPASQVAARPFCRHLITPACRRPCVLAAT